MNTETALTGIAADRGNGTSIRLSGAAHHVAVHAGLSAEDDFLIAAATPLGYDGIIDSVVTWHGLRLSAATRSGKFLCVKSYEFRTVGVPANCGQPLEAKVAIDGFFADDAQSVTSRRWVRRNEVVSAHTVDDRGDIARVTLRDGFIFAVDADLFDRWLRR